MKRLILIITLFSILGASAQTEEFFNKANDFFAEYVKNGLVDYSSVKENPELLDEVLKLGREISVSSSSKKTYQAFWINGYNLLVIEGVVNNYPVKSPLDIKGFFDVKKRSFGGKEITLNDIENKLLREKFPNEARFHFVLVCAGLGCPPIINQAYMPDKLESQLQAQTKKALNNPDFIKVRNNKVEVSQIFEWYKVDFVRDGKNEIDFINDFRIEKINSSLVFGYYPYDWALNSLK